MKNRCRFHATYLTISEEKNPVGYLSCSGLDEIIRPACSCATVNTRSNTFFSTPHANNQPFFDGLADYMAPRIGNEFFTIHTTHEDARKLVYETAAAVHDVTRDISNAHLVFFPAGSIEIARLIQKKGYPAHRMHALEISGSAGTETGFALIKSAIPPELLNPTNEAVIPEDIFDSVITIFAFIRARGEHRDSSKEHITWLRTLGERLKVAHENGNDDLPAYADFAKAAAEEHVSMLPVWSKNKQARNALVIRTFAPVPTIQRKLLEYYPIMLLPETLWALGGNYVMDTGVLWSRIIPELDPRLQDDPRVTQYIGWLLRAVRIGPLAYFETENQEKNVVNFISRVATEMLSS